MILRNKNVTTNDTAIKYALGGIYLADNVPDKYGNLLDYNFMKFDQKVKYYS